MNADSALDAAELARARGLLAAPPARSATGSALAAAAFAAITAMALAVTVILMPLAGPVKPPASAEIGRT